MTKSFNIQSLESLGAYPQAESKTETENLSVSTIKLNNHERLQHEESIPPLARPKPINDSNSSSIPQVKKHLQLIKTTNEINKLIDEVNRKITNEEFLAVIVEKVTGKQSVLVGGFKGHPGKGGSGKWFARPYLPNVTLFNPGENNYFTWASFAPDPNGKYFRRKTDFAALHVLVLDDIGTKVAALDQLPLPPSWVLETSPSNYQVGYIFSKPVVDAEIAERVMRAIIATGFCDPGASGPLTRYARLPVGVNGKHDPPFDCRLKEWHPGRQYTVEELINGFGLEDHIKLNKSKRVIQYDKSRYGEESEIYLEALSENIVITKLKHGGYYIKRSHVYKRHEIKCPFDNNHTDNQGGNAFYIEPDIVRKSGYFYCSNSSCKNKNIYDLCNLFNIDFVDAGNLPRIRIVDGFMDDIIDSIEKVMAENGKFFQRGGEIVTIKIDHYKKEPLISKISFPLFIRYLNIMIRFERFDKRYNEWVKSNPPMSYSKLLYDGGEFKYLPILNLLVRQPYLRHNLSLITRPGYDKDTGVFGYFDKNKFSISRNPTFQDAIDSLSKIKELMIGFKFKSEHDRAAACSAIIAATIRASLQQSPMYHYRAPQASSGKSYLCRFTSIFSTPLTVPAVNFPATEEECGKILLALLLLSPEVIFFDNLNSDLVPYKSMCSVLTEEYFTNRLLGASKTVTVPTKTLFISNGNNVGPVGDMSRRVVTIDLDPACENPAQRSFETDPVSTVLANREYYVSLVLTIIMAWIAAGSPRANVPPIASYEMWSDLCRQPLLWLGDQDPATSLFRSLDQDPDREILGRLLHAWYSCFQNRPKMIREAVDMASDELHMVFMDIAAGDRDNLNRKRLGRWISRHASRIVDGLKFEKESGTRSAEAWRVESLS